MAVGVLALQGSFNEHIAALRRIGARGVEIRKAEQLQNVFSLIIPGGESTTMAKLAELNNLFPALREFVKMGKPVWGTCAGLIFLADRATGQKIGGQELIGGLDCTVHRNFFGSQGNLIFKEFDIRKEAGSSFRAISKDIKVQVSENYLEVHLFWAGKGTCCIPDVGTYGPSISAISATPDFIPSVSNDPPANLSTKKDNTGLIVGIVVPVAVVSLLAVFVVFFFIQRRKARNAYEDEGYSHPNIPFSDY